MHYFHSGCYENNAFLYIRIANLKSYQDMKKEVDVKVCYVEMLEIQEKEYIL